MFKKLDVLGKTKVNEIWARVGADGEVDRNHVYLLVKKKDKDKAPEKKHRAYFLSTEVGARFEELVDFINEYGAFFEGDSPRANNKGRWYYLVTVLWALGNNISYDEAEKQNPRFAQLKAFDTGWVSDEAERDFYDKYDVIDCGRGNIVTNTHPTYKANSCQYRLMSNGDIGVTIERERPANFNNWSDEEQEKWQGYVTAYTNGAEGLYDVIRAFGWRRQTGKQTSDGERANAGYCTTDGSDIPMERIVWEYLHGNITSTNREAIREQAEDLYKARNKDLQIDHLTNVQENNRPWALALMPGYINASLSDSRALIQEPYYFYTTHDPITDECLVCCGCESSGYQRKFKFGDLSKFDKLRYENAEAYLACFKAFQNAVPKGYKGREGGESLLTKYGTTKNGMNREGGADSPDNPIPALLKENRSDFAEYTGQDFSDMAEGSKH